MPLLSLADFDKTLKLNQLLYNNPLLNSLSAAQILSAEQILNSSNSTNKQTNYSRYKTELCRQYSENGQCKYGDKCQFAHGLDELKDVKRHPKYKTDFCKTFHSKGFCPYGPRCHFIHDLNEKFESTSQTCTKSKVEQNQIQSQLTNSLLLNLKNEIDSQTKIDCQEDLLNLVLLKKTCNETNQLIVNNTCLLQSLNAESKHQTSLNASPSSTSSSTSCNGLLSNSSSDQFESELLPQLRNNALSPGLQELQTPVRTRSSVSSTSSSLSTLSSASISTTSSTSFDFYSQQQQQHQHHHQKILNLIGLASDEISNKSKLNFNFNNSNQLIW